MSDERIRLDLRQARRNLKEISAQLQHLATSIQAEHGGDWEERYVAEGVGDMQDHANGGKP